jgi:hypothetical protein
VDFGSGCTVFFPCSAALFEACGRQSEGRISPVSRVITFEGWEIHAPADTTDEVVVRVLGAIPSAANSSPKSP